MPPFDANAGATLIIPQVVGIEQADDLISIVAYPLLTKQQQLLIRTESSDPEVEHLILRPAVLLRSELTLKPVTDTAVDWHAPPFCERIPKYEDPVDVGRLFQEVFPVP